MYIQINESDIWIERYVNCWMWCSIYSMLMTFSDCLPFSLLEQIFFLLQLAKGHRLYHLHCLWIHIFYFIGHCNCKVCIRRYVIWLVVYHIAWKCQIIISLIWSLSCMKSFFPFYNNTVSGPPVLSTKYNWKKLFTSVFIAVAVSGGMFCHFFVLFYFMHTAMYSTYLYIFPFLTQTLHCCVKNPF